MSRRPTAPHKTPRRVPPMLQVQEVATGPVKVAAPEPNPAPRSGTDMTDEDIEKMLKAAYT